MSSVTPGAFAKLDAARQKHAVDAAVSHIQKVRASAPLEILAIQKELKRRQLLELKNVPAVYRPLIEPCRYKGAHGGRGTGKSHFFAELLLSRMLKSKTLAVCLREFQVSLEQSVKRLLTDKIHYYDLADQFRILETHIEAPHDGLIIFNGMRNHTATSIKSLEGYHIAWFEEAQTCSERSLTFLRPTIRAAGSELWFSWNPSTAKDPVDKFLRDPDTLASPHFKVVKSTYEDNPYFPAELRLDMEWDRARDTDKYLHVWMGEYENKSEARVFKNWSVEDFETPDDAVLYYGADWGFSVDPSVLVRMWIKGKTLYVDYEAYRIGCEVDHLPALFDQVPQSRAWPIIADSARPETISYLRRNGFPRIGPAKKGAGSVEEGVIFLQSYDIKVHSRCKHTIDELTHYSFKVDPLTGMVTPHLADRKNHVIDSLRYGAESLRAPVEEADFCSW